MARRSKGERFKNAIFQRLSEGATPVDIRNEFPEVPTATVYVWVKEYRLTGKIPELIDVIPESQEPEKARRSPTQKLKAALSVVKFPDAPAPSNFEDIDLSADLFAIRRVLKGLAEDPAVSPTVKVQSCGMWMRLLELRHTGKVEVMTNDDFVDTDLSAEDSEELISSFMEMKDVS